MLFVDYVFDLLPSGSIVFDKELTPDTLNVEDGDEFVVKVKEQRIIFEKKG